MLFRDVKPGFSLYSFDRINVKFKELKVLSVTPPHYDPNFPGATISDMVVDMNIEGEQIPYTFKERSESATIGGNIVVSTSLDGALLEVESLLAQSEQALAQRDKLENNVAECKKILTKHSAKYKKDVETEQRFSTMEDAIGGLKSDMTELKGMMQSFIKELKG